MRHEIYSQNKGVKTAIDWKKKNSSGQSFGKKAALLGGKDELCLRESRQTQRKGYSATREPVQNLRKPIKASAKKIQAPVRGGRPF